jgi:hypothetical protein
MKRLNGMAPDQLRRWLAAIVILHFVVAVAHGIAHRGAEVSLTPAGLAFVIIVIQLGPLIGLALTRVRPRAGAAIAAGSLAGAWMFGVWNHFAVPGADNVAQVDARWQILFGSTAVILAVLEAAGAFVGFAASRERLE